MPYSIDYIENESGLIVNWSGIARGEEVIQSYHDRFSPLERLTTLRYIITDYSGMESFDMSNAEIKIIAEISNEAAKHNTDLYAVAVMPSDIGYGMARMYQSYVDDDVTGWHTMVTRTRQEAETWLIKMLDNNLSFKDDGRK